ncbi:MAG: RNA polymerase sigma factor [Bacteroidota bacterium]
MNITPQLLKACKRQDRRAQSALYKACFQPLMGICMRYQKNEADAVAALNQAFLKIIQKLDTYPPKVPFEAWAKRITINTLIDVYRAQKRHQDKVAYYEFYETDDFTGLVSFNEADQQLDAQEIEQLIQQLPDMSRKVFNLFAIDGYSHKEICKMLDISEGTSKWHVSSARKFLRKRLEHLIHSSNQTIKT